MVDQYSILKTKREHCRNGQHTKILFTSFQEKCYAIEYYKSYDNSRPIKRNFTGFGSVIPYTNPTQHCCYIPKQIKKHFLFAK